jgi:hypothetical protein
MVEGTSEEGIRAMRTVMLALALVANNRCGRGLLACGTCAESDRWIDNRRGTE